MKKLFILLPAMLLSLAINAAVININTETSDALRVALNSAADGDEIVMSAGTYVESNGGYIAFTAKHVTVKAAEGANVIIQPKVPVTITEGGCAHFENVKFDVSKLTELANWYEHLIYATDANTSNSMILEGCEIYGFTLNKSLLFCGSSNRLASVTINNCYFHNIMKSCLFVESTEAINISISNSTFANITTDAGSYYAGVIDSRATSGSFSVDHCTFYNVQAMNTDYAAIGNNNTPSGSVVSNCIFAMPSSVDGVRAIRNIEQANNCLTFNYIKDGGGIHSSVTKNNCILNQDPLFADAENGDFSLAGDFVTSTPSPARYAGTDGSHLGDPRWHSAETFPSTDFEEPYAFIGAKAVVNGSMELDGSSYIHSTTNGGNAIWKVRATKACAVQVTLNMSDATTSGHTYQVEVFDSENNSVGALIEGGWYSNTDDKTLAGSIYLPAADDYKIVLTNSVSGSKATIKGITLTYVGGNVIDIPATLNVNEAWFSFNGTRADGAISYSSIGSGCWAKWNVSLDNAAWYDITVNIRNEYGHNYSVEFFEAGNLTPVASVSEGGTKYGKDATLYPVKLGGLYLPAGDYEVKVSNAVGDAALLGAVVAYMGGAVQNMPGTTDISEAWYSLQGTREEGKIDFPDDHIHEGWVKWNVSFAEAANYNVTVNIDNENGHNYTVALYTSESDESPIIVTEGAQKGTIGTLELGSMEVPAGSYIMKVTNATEDSDAKLISVNFAYAGGEPVDLSKDAPANLLANADAIVSDDWSIEGGKIVHPESKALTGWAKWNVNCADYGNYNVTVNISSDNGHGVRVEVFEDEAEPAIYTLDEASSTKYDEGDMALDLGNITLSDREYVVKVSNTVSSSHVQIASIVLSYRGGAVISLPADPIPFGDAMLSARAYMGGDDLHFTDAEHYGTISNEWAKWNVSAEAGLYNFSLGVSSTNHSVFEMTVLDSEEHQVYQYSKSSNTTETLTYSVVFPSDGNYVIKLVNTNNHANGYLTSFSCTKPSVITLDEAAIDNSIIVANYRTGALNIQLIRTITSGMYNTICLPFDVDNAQLKSVFGNDVVLKQMESATVDEGDVLNLNFEDAESIYRGTPYLIKTSHNVVNPIFAGVEIKAKVGDATAGTNADFIGNFVAGTIPADPNNLFLGANNALYFPAVNIEILGMRAYFNVHGASAGAIKRARIVERDQTATGIETLMEQPSLAGKKILVNGQLIIVRDGIRYNVMGAKLQ